MRKIKWGDRVRWRLNRAWAGVYAGPDPRQDGLGLVLISEPYHASHETYRSWRLEDIELMPERITVTFDEDDLRTFVGAHFWTAPGDATWPLVYEARRALSALDARRARESRWGAWGLTPAPHGR